MLLTVFLTTAGLFPTLSSAAPLPTGRRLLLISVDGLSPKSLTDSSLELTHLRRLQQSGAWAEGVQGVFPTRTYPVHTSLMTGVPPRLHGILTNKVFDPEGQSSEAWHWYAAEIRIPNLLSRAYEAGLTTVAVGWPVTVGLELDALVPEFWRSGSKHPSDLHLLEALSTPGLFRELEEARRAKLRYPVSDRDRTDLALYLLRTRKPHLVALHWIEHDSAQHSHGPGSPEARQSLEALDRELGRVLDALKEVGLDRETLVVIVSDHGFLPVSKVVAPNVKLREAGWIETDSSGKIRSYQAVFHPEGGAALLALHPSAGTDLLAAIAKLFEKEAEKPGSPIRAVLRAPEIAALGGDPAVFPLALDAREGFTFSGAASGPWVQPTDRRGDHGHAPVRPELESALILAGPGLSRFGNLGTVPLTRIAPTLARYLGISLAPEADPPFDWLEAPAPSPATSETKR